MKKNLKITDIDYDFYSHPLTGNLTVKNGPDAIKQAVRTLVLLNIFEKPFSIISGNIKNKLFENFSLPLETKLREEITVLLTTYEPRIQVDSVVFGSEENALNISITYTILGEDLPQQIVNLEVTRSR
jgi:phage baseplate assembly protein W